MAWAQQVFPELSLDEAVDALWKTIFATARVDQPEPIAAWLAHGRRRERIAQALIRLQVRSLHFVDSAPGPDGRPATDLVIGLSEAPVWIGGPSQTPQGVYFDPNIPSEEVFTTPHNMHVEGWVTTSKPTFPFGRRVEGAWFRFEKGIVVDYHAEEGQSVLDEFFKIPGAQRLGEIALVDVRSPVNQAGRVFYEILFDENCVCHMAFGDAYPGGVVDGESMTADEREAVGINSSQTHVDFMIGTPTMDVTGIMADGVRVPIMQQGHFVDALTSRQDEVDEHKEATST
jgi:aminopeptidase